MEENIACVNCGESSEFKFPDDCNWFCTYECYEEFNEINK